MNLYAGSSVIIILKFLNKNILFVYGERTLNRCWLISIEFTFSLRNTILLLNRVLPFHVLNVFLIEKKTLLSDCFD